MTDYVKCNTDIRRRIRIVKDELQKLNKILIYRKMFLKAKKRVLNIFAIFDVLYGSKCGTIFSWMKNRLETTKC